MKLGVLDNRNRQVSAPIIIQRIGIVLTSIPIYSLQSFNSILGQYEKRKGVKLDITRTPKEELEARLKENPKDILAMFFLAWERGGGAMDSEGLANGDWPEWKPKSVIDVI